MTHNKDKLKQLFKKMAKIGNIWLKNNTEKQNVRKKIKSQKTKTDQKKKGQKINRD